jgi:hypothetical protein
MSQHATDPSLLNELTLNIREIMKIIIALVIATVMLFDDPTATAEVVSHCYMYLHCCEH